MRVAQVREQFGTLRFHIRDGNDRVWGMIDMAVALSAVISKQKAGDQSAVVKHHHK